MEDLISIIIPAYNVADYLDRCMESVINQTYENIEIVLLNDGSTDGVTGDKCYEWAKKDERIIFVNKKNEHSGPTRNLGIEISHGKYLTFIDSDDYIDKTFVEKLYRQMIKEDAEIVCCDYYRIYYNSYNDGRKQNSIYRCHSNRTINHTNCNRLLNVVNGLGCTKLYDKRLFTEYNLKEIDEATEDLEIVPKLVYLAKNIAFVHEPLYYYFLDRPGNDTSSIKQVSGCIVSLTSLAEYFIAHQWFDDCYKQLEEIFVSIYLGMMQKVHEKCSDKEIETWENKYQELLSNYFPDWNKASSYTLFGSYNLRMIIAAYSSKVSQNLDRYMYSSLCSAVSVKEKMELNVSIENSFRQQMILKDINKDWLNNLKNGATSDYVILDFIEERFDIIDISGNYITDSGEWQQALNDEMAAYPRIKNATIEYIELWKRSCDKLVEMLMNRYAPDKIILIRNLYMEYYGDNQKERVFQNQSEIREKNKMLCEFYDYFILKFPDIHVIESGEDSLCYSEKNGLYGCNYYTANDAYYWHMAEKLDDELNKKGCGVYNNEI